MNYKSAIPAVFIPVCTAFAIQDTPPVTPMVSHLQTMIDGHDKLNASQKTRLAFLLTNAEEIDMGSTCESADLPMDLQLSAVDIITAKSAFLNRKTHDTLAVASFRSKTEHYKSAYKAQHDVYNGTVRSLNLQVRRSGDLTGKTVSLLRENVQIWNEAPAFQFVSENYEIAPTFR